MTFIRNIIISFIIVFLAGCYPESNILPEESDTVYTNAHPDANFHNYKYYQLADSVLRINDYGETIVIRGTYDQLVIDRVAENLNANGFVRVTDKDTITADVDVFISDLSSITITQFWNYIPYWYYTGLNSYNSETAYAYFPLGFPTSQLIALRSNIIVDMVDHEAVIIDNQTTYPVYWRAVTTGVYNNNMYSRLVRNIDQMFFQSPYLKASK